MNVSRLQRWDVFCRVIDNFGDIGVSWRLARQLAAEHRASVRLWVDDPVSLRALCPTVNVDAFPQVVEGVTVFRFDEESGYGPPADVVIEAFGCGLPEQYVDAFAARDAKPLWIVLEYLSAEEWVRAHHGLPSPHPRLGVPRYFFFPGFGEGTGGLLREADLPARRDGFDEAAKRAFWRRVGFDVPTEEMTVVSLFAYPSAPVLPWLEVCAASATPITVMMPEGPLAARVREALAFGSARSLRLGKLELRCLPFLPQTDYDTLLWACDVNFVRGEDSFVRAQWAGRPFVWHIYPQDAGAHRVKLDAFLDRFLGCAGVGMPPNAAQTVRDWWHAWNGMDGTPGIARVADAWPAFLATLPAQRRALGSWQAVLLRAGDLAGNLVKFCEKMI